MATRKKESPIGKEKRGISPTFPRNTATTNRRSPNPSPARPGSSDSTSSEKHIPNYLKPTISSTGVDHHSVVHHHARKPASSSTDGTIHKLALSRRKSLDRPPPPQVPKEKSLRYSSSFSPKSTTIASPRTPSDRLSRAAPKDAGKKQGLHPRLANVKKSSNGTKKKENETSSEITKTPNEIPGIADIPQPQEEEPQSIVVNEEVTVNSESNYETPAEIVHVEDKEHIDDPQQAEPEIKKHEEIKITEPSTDAADNQDSPSSFKMEELEEQNSLAEGTNTNHLESEQEVANKTSIDSVPENVAGEPESEAQEQATGEAVDKNEEAIEGSQVVDSEETVEVENAAKDVKQEVAQEVQQEADQEVKQEAAQEVQQEAAQEVKPEAAQEVKPEAAKEVKQEAPKEVKQEVENVAPKRSHPAQAKKESSVSNDVIEETASKLREQRRNKVRALAGAFETVISLQEPK